MAHPAPASQPSAACWRSALNLLYIDTGSMYRAVALAVMESSMNGKDDVAVGALAARVDIDLEGDPDSLKVTLAGGM